MPFGPGRRKAIGFPHGVRTKQARTYIACRPVGDATPRPTRPSPPDTRRERCLHERDHSLRKRSNLPAPPEPVGTGYRRSHITHYPRKG